MIYCSYSPTQQLNDSLPLRSNRCIKKQGYMNWKETAIKIPNGATEERINCYLLDFQHRHLQSKNYKHPGAAGLLAKTPGRATCALRSMLTRVPTKDINRKRIRAAAVTPRCFSQQSSFTSLQFCLKMTYFCVHRHQRQKTPSLRGRTENEQYLTNTIGNGKAV